MRAIDPIEPIRRRDITHLLEPREVAILDNIASSETERRALRKAVQLTKSLSNAIEEESGVEPSRRKRCQKLHRSNKRD
jgi:hypothetical protein